MSLIDDLLASAMQREQPFQQSAPPTGLSGLTVTAGRRPPPGPQVQIMPPQAPLQLAPPMQSPDFSNGQSPQPASVNYDNSGDVAAVQQALQAEGTPRGGMANPGVYGLLPQGLQHGVLRNALGALGDAFLVGSGRQPVYEPRMQQQELGNAMAGVNINDPASVQAAASRMAATGAPGANEMADRLYTQAEQAALRKQYMEYNQDYRQQIVGERNQNLIRQAAPQMQYYLAQAKDAEDYKRRLAYVQSRVSAIDPHADATEELAVPPPNEWQPGMLAQLGMTASQGQQSADRAAQRDVSVQNNQASNAARVRAAEVTAGGHVQAASISANRPSEQQFNEWYQSQRARGLPTTPEQDQEYLHNTQVSVHSRRPIPHAAVRPAAHSFQPNAIYTDAHGNRARYNSNGTWTPIH